MADGVRVVYLITSHALPEQLLRLVGTLRRGSPNSAVVIHHDARSSHVDTAALAALGAQLIEPPTPADWGGFSHLQAMLRCLRWLTANVAFDWMVLLSGQDYPVRPLAEIEASLADADVDGYIETRPCDAPARGSVPDEFSGRYHHHWRRLPLPLRARTAVGLTRRASGLVQLRVMPSGTWLGLPARSTPFGAGLRCHFGSDWFTLSRRAVEGAGAYLDTAAGRRLLKHYRHTLFPTESCLQTVLANDPALALSGDYRRYLAFTDPLKPSSPRILTLDDLGAMLSSGADFARKFDIRVDATVLDAIDARVHATAQSRG